MPVRIRPCVINMDKQKLKEYIKNDISLNKIAKLEDLCLTSVRYWVKKFGLKIQNQSFKSGKCDYSKFEIKRVVYYTSNDWKRIEKLCNEGFTYKEIKGIEGVSETSIYKALKSGKIKRNPFSKEVERSRLKRRPKKNISEETKMKLSISRKKWLLANPEKHPWKNNSKFKSVPCEKFKKFLSNRNIKFVSELSPFPDEKAFCIDIAFPSLMIGLEVNGNQHYERDGSLKPYYRERQHFLETKGWKIYQIHYKKCFCIDFLEDLIKEIFSINHRMPP